MKRMICVSATIMIASIVVAANIANPDLPNSKKAIDTTLMVRLDPAATEARLIIPRSQIKQLRAELESLENGGDSTMAAITSESGFSETQTIISGLFITLALVFGGLWFLRSKRIPQPTSGAAAAVAILYVIGGFAAIVYGNAGPPPEARSITGKMFSQAVHIYGFGSGKIKLEVSDKEGNPLLIVPNPKTVTTPDE